MSIFLWSHLRACYCRCLPRQLLIISGSLLSQETGKLHEEMINEWGRIIVYYVMK